MPLSEEEQRILHEMEQKLYEHDRGFADRVSTASARGRPGRRGRWAVVIFLAGLALMLASFRSSLLIASFAFLVMLVSALTFVHHMGKGEPSRLGGPGRSTKGHGVSEEWSEMRRRMRSRFGNRD